MNPLVAGPQFVDTIAQVVGFRPAEFVPQSFKSFEPHQTLLPSFCGKLVEPLDHWHGPGVLLIVNKLGYHAAYPVFSLLRTAVNVPENGRRSKLPAGWERDSLGEYTNRMCTSSCGSPGAR